MAYEIVFTPEADEEIAALRAFDRAAIYDAIDRHLSHQPAQTSRSRIKRLEQPADAQYRLRVGQYRVYYDVEDFRVIVLHIAEKGNRETEIGGSE